MKVSINSPVIPLVKLAQAAQAVVPHPPEMERSSEELKERRMRFYKNLLKNMVGMTGGYFVGHMSGDLLSRLARNTRFAKRFKSLPQAERIHKLQPLLALMGAAAGLGTTMALTFPKKKAEEDAGYYVPPLPR